METKGFMEDWKNIHNVQNLYASAEWRLLFLRCSREVSVTRIKKDEGRCRHVVLIDPCCCSVITGSVLLFVRVRAVLLDKLQIEK